MLILKMGDNDGSVIRFKGRSKGQEGQVPLTTFVEKRQLSTRFRSRESDRGVCPHCPGYIGRRTINNIRWRGAGVRGTGTLTRLKKYNLSMPRTAREQASSGVYHVMLRGINRQQIFECPEDYEHFVSVLRRLDLNIYAYCLMGNHVVVDILWQGREKGVSWILMKKRVKVPVPLTLLIRFNGSAWRIGRFWSLARLSVRAGAVGSGACRGARGEVAWKNIFIK